LFVREYRQLIVHEVVYDSLLVNGYSRPAEHRSTSMAFVKDSHRCQLFLEYPCLVLRHVVPLLVNEGLDVPRWSVGSRDRAAWSLPCSALVLQHLHLVVIIILNLIIDDLSLCAKLLLDLHGSFKVKPRDILKHVPIIFNESRPGVASSPLLPADVL